MERADEKVSCGIVEPAGFERGLNNFLGAMVSS
jgi:hypothetical protein